VAGPEGLALVRKAIRRGEAELAAASGRRDSEQT
jgi:hypothetical protein